MNIKPYSHYNEEEILSLYKSVEWSNYYEHSEMLAKAFAASLCVLGAYDNDKLIGIIRCVGDGHSIVFIQDLLVHPDHQRKGIGTELMNAILDRYQNVYQIELATDNTERTIAFYKSLGFCPLQEIGCCGFLRIGQF